ncbi:MAG: helix-turn-helix domain-containing protein [Gaiellaceae bacterium]
MFEIGNSLREARLRQGLDLPRIEADTKIRAKYLRALEEESFEVLPAETYVKGFLRAYAEYLGLDGQLYVDEFNSRFTTAEEPLAAPSKRPRPRPRAIESNFVVVALAGIVAVTVLVVLAAAELGDDGPATPPFVPSTPTTTAAESPTTTAAEPVAPKPRKAKLVLTAVNGDCWLEVRVGSVSGETLYAGTLELGQTQRFVRKRLWISLGNPANVHATLNGKVVRDFPTASAVVVVTAKGVRTVSTA